jgi:hypothetical protein
MIPPSARAETRGCNSPGYLRVPGRELPGSRASRLSVSGSEGQPQEAARHRFRAYMAEFAVQRALRVPVPDVRDKTGRSARRGPVVNRKDQEENHG